MKFNEDTTLQFNKLGAMFSLCDDENEVVEWLCGRGVEIPRGHNQCWLLAEYLRPMTWLGVISVPLTNSQPVTVRDMHGLQVVLCNIIHDEFNDHGYTGFGDVSRNLLGQQCQYGSRYVTGLDDRYPNLGEGLRFKNLDRGDYHAILIHRDDVEELVARYKEYTGKGG